MNGYELSDKFTAIVQMSCKPGNMRRYKPDEIIDENRTVRWNREEVIRRNAAYSNAVKALTEQRNEMLGNMYEEIYAYIMTQVGNNCTYEQAKLIWSYAWKYGKALGYSYVWGCLEEFINYAKFLREG